MSPSKLNPWLLVSIVCGMFYPPLIYFGIGVFPSQVFVLTGLALIGIRLLGLRDDPNNRIWKISFLITAAALTVMLFLDAHLAALAYPVFVSLSVALVFSASLLFPPTIVERMARITEPNLSSKGVTYTRHVTEVWIVVLLINAAISAMTALWGTIGQWALWNGLLSYILIGTLFIGEMAVRRVVRKCP